MTIFLDKHCALPWPGGQLSAQTQHSLLCWSQAELQLTCSRLVSRHLPLRVISVFTDELHVCDADQALLVADVEHSGHLGPAPAPDPHLAWPVQPQCR